MRLDLIYFEVRMVFSLAKKISPTLLMILLSLTIATIAVYASDGATVAYTTTQQITGPDGICKKITNNSGTGLSNYVPTASIAEWQSFVANPPAGVTLATCGASCTPGSQIYTTSGTYTFVVPPGSAGCSFAVQVWGGGGSGNGVDKTDGGQSSWNGVLIAGGGSAGLNGFPGSAGGVASGGTNNINGGAGDLPAGGDAPYGGVGGTTVSSDGSAPGGGGGGDGGGGGGGYSSQVYAPGVLPGGSSVTVDVGDGGEVSGGQGSGATGKVWIVWN